MIYIQPSQPRSKLYDQLDSINFKKNDLDEVPSPVHVGVYFRQEVDAPKMEMYSLGKDQRGTDHFICWIYSSSINE